MDAFLYTLALLNILVVIAGVWLFYEQKISVTVALQLIMPFVNIIYAIKYLWMYLSSK